MVKHYTNGEITVVWEPDLCRHGGACARGLPAVFRPRLRPWIDLTPSDSTTIAAQVERCPSGALSWFKNGTGDPDNRSSS
jgi:putative redox protein